MGRPEDRGRGRPGGAEAEPLDAAIRELHERYGDAVEVPDRLFDLARRVADAYEGIGAEQPPSPEGRRPRR